MQQIVYNKYINLVGVEFEGFFKPELTFSHPEVPAKLFAEVGTDGSLQSDVHSRNLDLTGRELRTYPLTGEQLTDALAIMERYEEKKEYYLNASCGLHFHVSLKEKELYYNLIDENFYKAFSKMFKEGFKKVYDQRSPCHYSQERYTDYDANDPDRLNLLRRRDHVNRKFSLGSGSKYSFIHYQVSTRGTVEFRAYGGQYATVSGLRDFIQKTLNLIQQFIENPPVVKEEVYFDEKGEFIRTPDSFVAFALLPGANRRKTPLKRTVQIKRPTRLVDNPNSLSFLPVTAGRVGTYTGNI